MTHVQTPLNFCWPLLIQNNLNLRLPDCAGLDESFPSSLETVSSVMDILSCQLINRFKRMKSEPSFLLNASHLDLKVEARKFFNKISDNFSLLFPSQMLSIKMSFREKVVHLKSAKEMASFLIVKNVSLATTYPGVCTAYMMYMTVLRQRDLFLNSNWWKTFFEAPCPKRD